MKEIARRGKKRGGEASEEIMLMPVLRKAPI